MLGIILMILGGALVVISILGAILFLIEPLYKNFMIVFKRKDDYTYYTRPETKAILDKARKEYVVGLCVMIVIGVILFFVGYYMKYGERGIYSLFGNDGESIYEIENLSVQGEQAVGINASNNYVAEDKTEYPYYIIIKGDDIYYRNKEITRNELENELDKIGTINTIALIDGYVLMTSRLVFSKTQ